MLIQDNKSGIRVFQLEESEFTLRKRWSLQIFLIPTEVYPKSMTNEQKSHCQRPKCRKRTL